MKRESSLLRVRRVAGAWMLLALAISAARAASPAENHAFAAALKSFAGSWWERTENEFAQFAVEFPESERRPEAILRQAQARYWQTNSVGAWQLLSENIGQADKLADEYQFWIGKAQLQASNYQAAAEAYARLVSDFTNSARLPEAAYGEALAYSKLDQWPRVVEVLSRPDGVLQRAAQANPANEFVVRSLVLLGEANFLQKDYRAVEETLQPLAQQKLSAELGWRRQYLICRAQLAGGRLQEARQGATNLLELAAVSGQRSLQAESVAFEAGVLEQLNLPEEAIAAYEKNLAEGSPGERRREALLKIISLSLARNKTAETALRLEKFLGQFPKDEAADVALLTLGELRLQEHLAVPKAAGTNGVAAASPPATNRLQQAMALFDTLVKNFPESPLAGQALLNQGWCFWLEGKIIESRGAFEGAVQRLPFSADLATARFKLADVQFQLKDYASALTNYLAITANFSSLPEVKSNLLELALYQTVHAGLEAGDPASATNAVTQILAWYPTSFLAGRSVLVAGQAVSQAGDTRTARKILSDFLKQMPDSPDRPEVELAIARIHEQEANWTEAIRQYDGWVASFTNHPARVRAEYYRGLANYRAGLETNALRLFTNFVAQFSTNDLAPLAQYWVADCYRRLEDFKSAEENYQLLFQKWPPSDLTYQARLMAGRAAVARQGYADAIQYFTNLTFDLNCPPGMKAQALFEYGDATARLESADTNKPLANFEEAIRIFSKLQQLYPTNDLAPLARGRMGDCYLQLAVSDPKQYDAATLAYQQVIDAANAGAAARSQAEVGLAVVLDKQVDRSADPEQTPLRKRALEHYLNVAYEKNLRDGERADPFWVKKAGSEAAKLAEELQLWKQAADLYEYLLKLLPATRPALENKLLKAREHLTGGNK